MQENPTNSNSGSIVETLGLPTPHDYSLQGNERIVAVLAQKIDELTQELHDLKKDKILSETGLSREQLEETGMDFDLPARIKSGRGYRPIMAHEILDAKKVVKEKFPTLVGSGIISSSTLAVVVPAPN
jgi:hypothetical protein